MIRIITNEWKGWWRTGQFRWVIALFAVILVAVAYFGVRDVNNRQAMIDRSRDQVREQWESMGPSNPHSAAHYGSYSFKPLTPLSALDEGINMTVGRVLRLEGHVQNEAVHSAGSQSEFMAYFGPLRASVILQFILPLFIIFITYYSIKSEHEQGRARLLKMQGLSYTRLILGKVLAVWLFVLVVFVATILVQWVSFGQPLGTDLLLRSLLLLLAYAGFYWIISILTAVFSVRWTKNASALTVMLAVWVLWLIFLPKITGWYVDDRSPLPSRQEFTEAMRDDHSKGLDGHNPTDEREKVLRDSVLSAYGVASVDSLPINFDGILMQADEEYGNKVWDKHYGTLFDRMLDQKNKVQMAGMINPYNALQSLSMGICGTDLWSHMHFQQEAESYRREFIKVLNDEHAYGGSKNGDWGWKAEQAFFNDIEDFHYQTPAYEKAASVYRFDWFSLGLWVLLSSFAFVYTTRKSEEADL